MNKNDSQFEVDPDNTSDETETLSVTSNDGSNPPNPIKTVDATSASNSTE